MDARAEGVIAEKERLIVVLRARVVELEGENAGLEDSASGWREESLRRTRDGWEQKDVIYHLLAERNELRAEVASLKK